MAETKKRPDRAARTPRAPRPPRLGRGLSSLMAAPVAVAPPAQKTGDSRQQTAETRLGATPPSPSPSASAEPSAASPTASADSPQHAAPADEATTASADGDGLHHIPVEAIAPNPHQPREQFDEAALRSLAESIRRDGVMQPVILRATSKDGGASGQDGHYELVAGERRWRAARLAGLERIPAIVRQLDDQQIAEWALVENLQREDLNPIERAEAFRRLAERFELSHDRIGERVGLDRSTVSNLLRLLSLAPATQQLVRDDLLSMGQARALAGLSDPARQADLAKRAVREGMSVREVEKAVRSLSQTDGSSNGEENEARPRAARSSHFDDLERQIGTQLGARVAISAGRKKGAGKLTIEFYSLDQFDVLLGKLGVETQ